MARVYREGLGTNRTEYLSFYARRYVQPRTADDRRSASASIGRLGPALPSTTHVNPAFPSLVPGIEFTGYDAPFNWNTLHPRLGATWALDERGKTILRGELQPLRRPARRQHHSASAIPAPTPDTSTIAGPTSTAIIFAQTEEVRLDLGLHRARQRLQPGEPDLGRLRQHASIPTSRPQ